MEAGIYFPLFLVLVEPKGQKAVFYLSADLQSPELFEERKPLSGTARRAGWQGFYYNFNKTKAGCLVRII